MAEARKDTEAKTSTTATSTKNFPWQIVIGIVVALVIIAGAIFCILQITGKHNDGSSKTTYTLENGQGQKIDAKYVSLDGYNYKLLAPTSLTPMSAEQIAEDYGDDAPDLVLTNADDTVNLTLSKPEDAISNDQISEYMELVEQIFDASEVEVLSTRITEVNGHNVGELKLMTEYTDEDIYNHMLVFSYDGKLAIITFNCLSSARDEWSKVGDEMVKSLIINE